MYNTKQDESVICARHGASKLVTIGYTLTYNDIQDMKYYDSLFFHILFQCLKATFARIWRYVSETFWAKSPNLEQRLRDRYSRRIQNIAQPTKPLPPLSILPTLVRINTLRRYI